MLTAPPHPKNVQEAACQEVAAQEDRILICLTLCEHSNCHQLQELGPLIKNTVWPEISDLACCSHPQSKSARFKLPVWNDALIDRQSMSLESLAQGKMHLLRCLAHELLVCQPLVTIFESVSSHNEKTPSENFDSYFPHRSKTFSLKVVSIRPLTLQNCSKQKAKNINRCEVFSCKTCKS